MTEAWEFLKAVWRVEFYRGALTALAVLLMVLVVYAGFKFILRRIFGFNRCSSIIIPGEKGNIVIAAPAAAAAIRAILTGFPELEVKRILIFRKNDAYSIELRCVFNRTGSPRGVPELHTLIEPLLKMELEKLFGITNIVSIPINVEHFSTADEDEDGRFQDGSLR